MDNEEWLIEFEKHAGPRLKSLFEGDLSTLPPELAEKLARLRDIEQGGNRKP